MNKVLVKALLGILNSKFLNESPCGYGYINGIDAVSYQELVNEDKQQPGITVREVIECINQFKTCPLRKGGLTVIENGETREGTIWDVHELRQSLTPRKETKYVNDPQREMPRYKYHKEVWALKIEKVIKHAHPDPKADDAVFEASQEFQGAHLFPEDKRYAPIPVDADYYRKHDPEPGGYYVRYKDGYESFSPSKAFEEGYTRI